MKKYEIQYLLDVRSSPYSRHTPDFNRDSIESISKKYNIKYVFMGDQLGGKPQADDCYDEIGRVDYKKLSNEPYFKNGINRLKLATAKNINVVLMCSERHPEECHRSKLIGDALEKDGVHIFHIDENNSIQTQENIINRIVNQSDMFGDDSLLHKSRGAYKGIKKMIERILTIGGYGFTEQKFFEKLLEERVIFFVISEKGEE